MTLDELFVDIENHISSKLPVVAYNSPESDLVRAFFQKNNKIYNLNSDTASGFLMSSFDQNTNVFFPLEVCDFVEVSFHLETLSQNQNPNLKHLDSKGLEFKENVSRAISAMHSSELEKVVLSHPWIQKIDHEVDIKKMFSMLLRKHPSAMVYLWYHPHFGLWLGASPESLLNIESSRFSTMSLAGTIKSKDGVAPKWSKKEIGEQDIVTEYIKNQLAPLTSLIKVHPTKNVKAGQLWHLQTKIIGVLDSNYSHSDLIKALHPTPAVCGFPTELAKVYIKENEGYDRRFYTGFLGEINMDAIKRRNQNRRNIENNAYNSSLSTTRLFVNLRCMEITGSQITIFVGAGITKQSEPEKEWIEICNKAETMSSIL